MSTDSLIVEDDEQLTAASWKDRANKQIVLVDDESKPSKSSCAVQMSLPVLTLKDAMYKVYVYLINRCLY